MQKPYCQDIEAEEALQGHQVWLCLPPGGHNHRLFKTYWRVFTRHSLLEGQDFLDRAQRLEIPEKDRLIEYHKSRGEQVWLYPLVLPRWDPEHMPWDLGHPRWENVHEWAPALGDE